MLRLYCFVTFATQVAEMAKLLHGRGIFGDECTIDMVRAEVASYSDFQFHQLAVTHAGSLKVRSQFCACMDGRN
jgi:hypothetical protein